MIVKLNDAANFQKEFLALQQYLAGLSGGKLQITAQTVNGTEIYSCMIPQAAMIQIMPCWMVSNGNFVFASHPAICQWMLQKDSPAERRTFRENAEYQQTIKSIPASIFGLEYIQSKTAFLIGVQQFQQFWPMITMMLQKEGMVLPAVCPDLRHLADQMGPGLAYSRLTEDGIEAHSEGPMMVNGPMTVAAAGLGVSIMMPALGRAREAAREVQCAANLSGIGKAISVYRNDHQGAYPQDLSTLVKEVDLPPEVLICPSAESEEKTKSYIYRGVDLKGQERPEWIVLHDKAGNHHNVRNVLFADGHVNKLKMAEFQKAIEKDNQIRREIGLPEKQAEEIPKGKDVSPSEGKL